MIADAGISLEWTCKYVLDSKKIIPRINNHEMLGRNLARMRKSRIINQGVYEECRLLGKIYNIAKHEISDHLPRTFDVLDGVVAYFSLRKMHNKLLDTIKHDSRSKEYAIYVAM